MTMNDAAMLILTILAGAALGAFFFGGLWLTVRRAMTVEQPALLVLGSMLGRTGLVLAGFYLVADGQWQPLLFCLVGFVAARLIFVRFLPENSPGPGPTGRVSRDAP